MIVENGTYILITYEGMCTPAIIESYDEINDEYIASNYYGMKFNLKENYFEVLVPDKDCANAYEAKLDDQFMVISNMFPYTDGIEEWNRCYFEEHSIGKAIEITKNYVVLEFEYGETVTFDWRDIKKYYE